MLNTVLLVDNEQLFHLVFEDVCSLLDIALSVESVQSADEAANIFRTLYETKAKKPDCVLVDATMPGSTFNGIELIRKINYEYGNNVVIGIISSVNDTNEQARAIQAGAQFCIIKTNDIEHRLEQFKKDYPHFKARTIPFQIYE